MWEKLKCAANKGNDFYACVEIKLSREEHKGGEDKSKTKKVAPIILPRERLFCSKNRDIFSASLDCIHTTLTEELNH